MIAQINKTNLFLFLIMIYVPCYSQIQLGDSLNNMQVIKTQKILITPNQIEDGYLVEKDGVTYEVCIDIDKKIYFISTKDTDFSFQELHVGSLFKDIKNVTNQYNLKGWGYVVENKSEWKYVFYVLRVKSKSKISCFFKYNPKHKGLLRNKENLIIKIE